MRRFAATLLAGGLLCSHAYPAQQQLIPIIREIRTSSAPLVTEWKTFVQMANYGGAPYVSLVQVAALLNGHLRWRPASRGVELSVQNQTISFPYHASHAWINGRRQRLRSPTVKNSEGFWVPVDFFASKAFFKATHTRLQWPPPAPAEEKAAERGKVKGERRMGQEGGKHAASVPSSVSAPPTADSVPPSPIASLPSEAAVLPAEPARAVRRIVIDPGHGGKDPGALGSHGIEEKAINLQLALDLAEYLRQRFNYQILLTRMDDRFIPLEDRAKLANDQHADLFISIHCNASLSSRLKGFEVYFLSETASDPHADAVARLENAPLALENKPVPSPSQVNSVLRSLVKTAYINEASALGALIDRHLADRLSEPSLGVKQAAFYVLRGAEMPAVLIETGFLSNSKEEKLLQNPKFREKLIEGVASGIAAYDLRKQKERVGR